MRILCFFAILAIFKLTSTVKYTGRCALATALKNENIRRSQLACWVCLIEKVSDGDTSKYMEKGNKKYYGLYQIPGEWCRVGRKGGKCNISCESLLDDKISDDTECALKIYNDKGFKHWSIWESRCKDKVMDIAREIFKCPGLQLTPRMGSVEENPSC